MNDRLATALSLIRAEMQKRDRTVVSIDGRCASGKTTLAAAIASALDEQGIPVTILHMDHFFLQPNQRTPARMQTPGGNVDRERFLSEVLLPLSRGESFAYRRYNCILKAIGGPLIHITPTPLTIVEGSYSCHPDLRAYYDLRLFLSVDPETQLDRIRIRNGEAAAEIFRNRWIPLEETYFAACAVEACCIKLP